MFVDVRRARSIRSTDDPDRKVIIPYWAFELVVSANDAERRVVTEALLDGGSGTEPLKIVQRTPYGDQCWRITKRVASVEGVRGLIGRLTELRATINYRGLSSELSAELFGPGGLPASGPEGGRPSADVSGGRP